MELASTIAVQERRKLETALRDADMMLDKADVSAADVLMRRAKLLIQLNRPAQALTGLKTILDYDPMNAKVHWLMSCLEDAPDESRLRQLQQALGDKCKAHDLSAKNADTGSVDYPALDEDDGYRLYALGKLLEDLGRFDEAFAAYGNGAAALARVAHNSVPVLDDDLADDIVQHFQDALTADWYKRKPVGLLGKGPVFVLGCAGSGLGYVESMLSMHPEIHAGGALPHFAHQVNRLVMEDPNAAITGDIIRRVALSDMHDLGVNYMISSRNSRGELPYFVDKQSRNFLYLPFIALALPDASIIHVKRCPIDTCLSDYKWLYSEGGHQYSYSFEALAKYYGQYQHIMDHTVPLLGDRVLEVDYEDLIAQPETEYARVFDHIGIDAISFDDAVEQEQTILETYDRLKDEPQHRWGTQLWRQYEQHVGPLVAALQDQGVKIDTCE